MLIKHLERRIKDLQWQLESIIPKTGIVYESIDIQYIYSIKEEIRMLKNELLSLKIRNKIESDGHAVFYVKKSYTPLNQRTQDILKRVASKRKKIINK